MRHRRLNVAAGLCSAAHTTTNILITNILLHRGQAVEEDRVRLLRLVRAAGHVLETEKLDEPRR